MRSCCVCLRWDLVQTDKVFDNLFTNLRRLQTRLGRRVFTSTIGSNILLKELKTHLSQLARALRSNEGRTPVVVTEEMGGNESRFRYSRWSIDQGDALKPLK